MSVLAAITAPVPTARRSGRVMVMVANVVSQTSAKSGWRYCMVLIPRLVVMVLE